jgi:Flp pilus assembly CpaE family ATPase
MVNDWADWDQQLYNGNAIVGTAAAIAILQIFFVVARLGTRCMQRMKLRVDDYLVLLSLVCISIFCSDSDYSNRALYRLQVWQNRQFMSYVSTNNQ